MMVDIRIVNNEVNMHTARGSQAADVTLKKNDKDIQNNISLKDPLKNKKEEKETKISLEELTKSLMKPNEIKRLLYLAIPFTRHLIAELDQNKGNILDKRG